MDYDVQFSSVQTLRNSIVQHEEDHLESDYGSNDKELLRSGSSGSEDEGNANNRCFPKFIAKINMRDPSFKVG